MLRGPARGLCCQRWFRREEWRKMFEAVQTLKAEYAELERQMSDPELHSDQANARRVGKRYAALAPVVRTYAEWQQTGDDIEAAKELAAEDPTFAEEATRLSTRRDELAE